MRGKLFILLNPIVLVLMVITFLLAFLMVASTGGSPLAALFYGYRVDNFSGINLLSVIRWLIMQMPIVFCIGYYLNYIFADKGIYSIIRHKSYPQWWLSQTGLMMAVCLFYSFLIHALIALLFAKRLDGGLLHAVYSALAFGINLAFLASIFSLVYLLSKRLESIIIAYFAMQLLVVADGFLGLGLALYLPFDWGMLQYIREFSGSGIHLSMVVSIQVILSLFITFYGCARVRHTGFIDEGGVSI